MGVLLCRWCLLEVFVGFVGFVIALLFFTESLLNTEYNLLIIASRHVS